jgi:arylsulfatase A-like enzyme
MPTDVVHDGVNLIPFLKGDNKDAPHKRLFWRVGGGSAHAIREGNWKLIRAKDKAPELYDLTKDISESKDQATTHPEVVARLVGELESWNKGLIPPAFSGLAGQRAAKQKHKENKKP